MPRRTPTPRPELGEPYDRRRYNELRHELALRHIRQRSSGSKRDFVSQLRAWDREHATAERPPAARKRAPATKPTRASRKPAPAASRPMSSSRVIRARRGCRFRLINVLLSPDFNGRWGEMAAAGVSPLWRDVHAAFLAHNSMLDTLHFQDALFVNVTPHVVLAHSAERLLQMWTEIVTMYRNAVAQAKDAAAHNDNVHSFFDFCAGRLDLLYLHMAMLLEPKLYELVMSDKIPGSDPFSRAKASPLPAAGSDAVKAATQSTNETKPKASTKAATAKTTAVKDTKPAPLKTSAHVDARPAPAQALTPSDTKLAPVKASALTDTKLAPTKASTDSKPAPSKAASSTDTKPSPEMAKAAIPIASVAAVVAAPATHVKLSKIPTQNPEMEEPPAPAVTKSAAVVVPPKPTAAKANKTVMKGKQSKPAATPPKPTAQKKPQKAAGKAKAASASLAKETKQTASPAKKKSAASPSKPKAPSKSTHGKASGGDKPVKPQKTSNGKRRREEDDSTAIIEVPSVSDIVPRSDKRVHTTTTISTALATRSTDMMLPPDEWDILENRLRKVNENIDRCHRGLAGLEVNVSDSYKQSLEADLRFYSAIKQRLQEQLLVVMQSGY